MRTYDAATYSDLTKNKALYMIKPVMQTEDVLGINSNSFQLVLDGVKCSARVDAEGRVHITKNGEEQMLYKAISTGGRYTRNRKRNHSRNRNRNRVRDHDRNSNNGY
jgi:hypothetical protein